MARFRRTLTIRREDHIGGLLGLLFLDPDGESQEAVMERLRQYLGPRMRVTKARVERDAIRVEVELIAFLDEAVRMVEAAEGLRLRGAKRAARAAFAEALRLDPLNERALTGLSTLQSETQQHAEALRNLRRSREAGGDSVRLLEAMARACVALERVPTAVGYLQRALDMAPDSADLRSALKMLGYEPPTTHQASRVDPQPLKVLPPKEES